MWSSLISLLASAASALSTYLRGKQQAKDQADGAASQQLADSAVVLSAAKSSVAIQNDIDGRSAADLRAEAENWRAEP